MLSTFTVTNTADSGTGSLRYEIGQANSAGGANTIAFNTNPSLGTDFNTPQTITLTSGSITLGAGTETIQGPTVGVTVSGDKASRVFVVNSGVTANISGLTITDGSTSVNGGGVWNAGTITLTGVTLSGNTATTGGGGGLYAKSGSKTTLTNCTVIDNLAGNQGGGLFNNGGTAKLTNSTLSDNSAAFGGGMESYGGPTTLTDCTVTDNSATDNGGGMDNFGPQTTTLSNCDISGNTAGFAGGLDNLGAHTLTLTNCTISGNTATDRFGGLYANSGSTTTLTNCTVSGNSSAEYGGGLAVVSGTMNLGNTIVAGNTATGSDPDVYGTVASKGHNLIGKTNGSSGWVSSDLTGTIASPRNPKLGTLGNNGGPTQTIALLTGSPAIDAGSNSITGLTIPTTDERGAQRGSAGLNAGTKVDIGAYEASSSYLVTSTADSSDVGTLRAAVGWANVSTNVNPANSPTAPNTIDFNTAGVFATQQTITLTGGQLTLSNTSTAEAITGPAAGVILSGGGLSRVFQVGASVTASLSGLTITGGSVSGSGGGLYNDGGTVTLTGCTISSNSASGNGGGILNTGTLTVSSTTSLTGNSASDGGGIYNSGTLNVSGATFTGNTASASGVGGGAGGGAIYSDNGTLVMTSGTFTDNTAPSGGGGAIEVLYGTATLSGGTFTGNVASGGAAIQDALATLTLSNSTFTSNSGTVFAGAIDNGSSTATVTNCTFTDNTAPFAGAINNFNRSEGGLSVSGSTFTGNEATAGQGGAIYNTLGSSTGVRTVNNSEFFGNQATSGGGAIYDNPTYGGSGAGLVLTVSNSTFTLNEATGASDGGALLNDGGTITLTDSTFSSDEAGSYGGAILTQGGYLALINSTLASNTAGVSGGAIDAQGPVTATFSTFSANQATSGGGGAIDNFDGQYSVTVQDSILAGDSAPYGPDFSNAVISLGNNLIRETDGSSGWVSSDLTGTIAQPLRAMLAPLGNYGGPTLTKALLPGSPAIGAGVAVSGVTTDQRGLIRGGTVDIGAFQTSLVVEFNLRIGRDHRRGPDPARRRQPGESVRRLGHQLRPGCLRHPEVHHPDGPARAEQHGAAELDRRPGRRGDRQRRREESGVPRGFRSDDIDQRADHHGRIDHRQRWRYRQQWHADAHQFHHHRRLGQRLGRRANQRRRVNYHHRLHFLGRLGGGQRRWA